MDSAEILGLVLGLGGGTLLLAIMAHVLHRTIEAGHLTRNGAVGIRTRATSQSDEAWQLAHRTAAPSLRRTALTGYALVIASVALLALGWVLEVSTSVAAAAVSVIGFLVVTAILLAGAAKGHAAAKTMDRSSTPPTTGGR